MLGRAARSHSWPGVLVGNRRRDRVRARCSSWSSPRTPQSIFVKREVERAVSKGKPVFPIRVREVMPSRSLELFISSAHWIDAWKPPMEKYLERLAAVDLGRGRGLSDRVHRHRHRPGRRSQGPGLRQSGRLPGRDRRRPRGPAPGGRWLVWLRLARPFRPGPITHGSGGPRESDVPAPSSAEVAAPAAQQVAPAAGPAAPGLQQAALPDAVAPNPRLIRRRPCPRSLGINRDVPNSLHLHLRQPRDSHAVALSGAPMSIRTIRSLQRRTACGSDHSRGGPVTVCAAKAVHLRREFPQRHQDRTTTAARIRASPSSV